MPQMINPFGYEDISFLNDSEMLEILKSRDGALIAMEKVYSKLENRNFYKQNIGKDNISYLDGNLEIQVYKQKDFHDKLLYQSVEFMYRICFRCRERISLEDQIVIMKNINIIEKTIEMKDNVANVVSAILERDFMDKQRRDIIQKFNDRLRTDKSFKEDKLKFLKEIKKELNKFYINKTHTTISDDLLRDEAWTKEEDETTHRDNHDNNLNMHHLEYTPRYIFFEDMKKDEVEYLRDRGISIADIKELINIHTQRDNNELSYIEDKYSKDLSKEIKDKIEDKIVEDVNSNITKIKLNSKQSLISY